MPKTSKISSLIAMMFAALLLIAVGSIQGGPPTHFGPEMGIYLDSSPPVMQTNYVIPQFGQSLSIERGVSVPILEYSYNMIPVQNDNTGPLTGILNFHDDFYNQSWRCCDNMMIAKAYPVPEYGIMSSEANNFRAREKV